VPRTSASALRRTHTTRAVELAGEARAAETAGWGAAEGVPREVLLYRAAAGSGRTTVATEEGEGSTGERPMTGNEGGTTDDARSRCGPGGGAEPLKGGHRGGSRGDMRRTGTRSGTGSHARVVEG
jgi:hypothetical protein